MQHDAPKHENMQKQYPPWLQTYHYCIRLNETAFPEVLQIMDNVLMKSEQQL